MHPNGFDDDDLEITVIKASPFSAPPSDRLGEDSSETSSDEDTHSSTSKVNVIYGEEADVEEVTSPYARILVSAEGESDRGRARSRNEDSFLVLRERSLFVIADGMGGYEGGQVASALAVETLRSAFEHNVFEAKTESATPVPRRGRELACAIQMANEAIWSSAKKTPQYSQMGTTVVTARFSPNKQRVYIGHVGDSRCYRLRGNVLRQLTTDHTLGELGMRGPVSHHLFQAVGIRPSITIDLIVDKPRANDLYLLCSDGLSKMAKDEEIRDILLNEPDLEAAVYTLIERANDQGGRDNVTVILLKVLERTKSHAALLPHRVPGVGAEDGSRGDKGTARESAKDTTLDSDDAPATEDPAGRAGSSIDAGVDVDVDVDVDDAVDVDVDVDDAVDSGPITKRTSAPGPEPTGESLPRGKDATTADSDRTADGTSVTAVGTEPTTQGKSSIANTEPTANGKPAPAGLDPTANGKPEPAGLDPTVNGKPAPAGLDPTVNGKPEPELTPSAKADDRPAPEPDGAGSSDCVTSEARPADGLGATPPSNAGPAADIQQSPKSEDGADPTARKESDPPRHLGAGKSS